MSSCRETTRETRRVELRRASRSGESAHVDERLDPMRLQHGDELIDVRVEWPRVQIVMCRQTETHGRCRRTGAARRSGRTSHRKRSNPTRGIFMARRTLPRPIVLFAPSPRSPRRVRRRSRRRRRRSRPDRTTWHRCPATTCPRWGRTRRRAGVPLSRRRRQGLVEDRERHAAQHGARDSARETAAGDARRIAAPTRAHHGRHQEVSDRQGRRSRGLSSRRSVHPGTRHALRRRTHEAAAAPR